MPWCYGAMVPWCYGMATCILLITTHLTPVVFTPPGFSCCCFFFFLGKRRQTCSPFSVRRQSFRIVCCGGLHLSAARRLRSTSDIDDSCTSFFVNSRSLMGCIRRGGGSRCTPSVSSRGRYQATSALYADVRFHFLMTHRNSDDSS